MFIFKKISGFLHLYRLSVFARFFLFYFLGCNAAIGFNFDFSYNLIVSLLVCGISFNFIYSLNSWFDADIDAINKPERPIPSGLISRSEALAYSLVLLGLSLVYPFVLFGLSAPTAICWFFPLAGILYSNPLYAFKKKKYLALLLITSATLLIFLLGYLVNGGIPNQSLYMLGLIFVIYGAAIVPLKDVGDVEGDSAGGSENWFTSTPSRRIFALSGILFVVVAGLSFFTDDIFMRFVTLINAGYYFCVLLFFSLYKKAWNSFFESFMLVLVFNAVLFWVWYAFLHVGLI